MRNTWERIRIRNMIRIRTNPDLQHCLQPGQTALKSPAFMRGKTSTTCLAVGPAAGRCSRQTSGPTHSPAPRSRWGGKLWRACKVGKVTVSIYFDQEWTSPSWSAKQTFCFTHLQIKTKFIITNSCTVPNYKQKTDFIVNWLFSLPIFEHKLLRVFNELSNFL